MRQSSSFFKNDARISRLRVGPMKNREIMREKLYGKLDVTLIKFAQTCKIFEFEYIGKVWQGWTKLRLELTSLRVEIVGLNKKTII